MDSHHHLWRLGSGRYPWLEGASEDDADPAGVGLLQHDYGVGELLADVGGLPLVGSVHVEAATDPRDTGAALAETRWLQAVADRDGLPSAIVARVELERPDVESQLEKHLSAARSLRGVRQMLDRDRLTGVSQRTALLKDPAWLRGLALLGGLGLVFDLQILPSQLEPAAQVADANPGVTFSLNHGGYHVPETVEAERDWRRGIAALAQCGNVVVKASGYDTVDPSWPQEGVDRYLGTLIDVFGPDKVLFASNFPVDGRTIGYRRLVEMDLHAMRHLSDDELDRVFYRNAVRTYRLDLERRHGAGSSRSATKETHV